MLTSVQPCGEATPSTVGEGRTFTRQHYLHTGSRDRRAGIWREQTPREALRVAVVWAGSGVAGSGGSLLGRVGAGGAAAGLGHNDPAATMPASVALRQ